MTNRPVGAELFHAGERTDMMKLTVTIRNFTNAPMNSGVPRGVWRVQTPAPPKFRIFYKAEPNFLL
jgi:hypothetical protein